MSNLTRKIMTMKRIETDIEGRRLLLEAIEESKIYFKRMQTEISKLGPSDVAPCYGLPMLPI